MDDIGAAQGGRDASSFDPAQSLINEEFVGWGGARYLEPSVRIARANGGRDLVLHYNSHAIDGEDLKIVLKDIADEIFVTLDYRVFAHEGIIRKTATLENRSPGNITVESLQAGVWYLPHGKGYRLSYVSGRWAGETSLTREEIHTGTRSAREQKGPYQSQLQPVVCDRQRYGDEENGRVWFGALGWSGNWRITVEQTPFQQVRVTGGLNPFDFGYPLKPGETLDTPPFYGGFIGGRFGRHRASMHRFERTEILPDRQYLAAAAGALQFMGSDQLQRG